MKRFAILLLPFALAGCVGTIASTAVDVVTLPVKVVSRGVDAATTSQSEADANRGRELRKADEERGRLAREMQQRCAKGRPLPTDVCQPVQPR
jgi:cell division septation protein DedD